MFKQSLLTKSSNINYYWNLSNDFNLLIQECLFVKGPHHMKLLYMNCDPRIELFGNTNNCITITITNTLNITISYIVPICFCNDIKTDDDLANAIQKSLNNQVYDNYPITFLVTQVTFENIITGPKPEQQEITTVYTIISNIPCTMDFSHKDSIGPLIGMGNGIFKNTTIAEGCRVHSIRTYQLIQVYNESGNAIANSQTPIPDPLVNPNLDYACCCSAPPLSDIECGIGFHDGYDEGWNDRTNCEPFYVPYLHFFEDSWDNQNYNYGWVFGYLLGYQDKALCRAYRNDFNCHIWESCQMRSRIAGYKTGYCRGKSDYGCNKPFVLTFQHSYKNSYNNKNYNFSYNIGYYTGYNDADHKIFDACYPEDSDSSGPDSENENENCTPTSISNLFYLLTYNNCDYILTKSVTKVAKHYKCTQPLITCLTSMIHNNTCTHNLSNAILTMLDSTNCTTNLISAVVSCINANTCVPSIITGIVILINNIKNCTTSFITCIIFLLNSNACSQEMVNALGSLMNHANCTPVLIGSLTNFLNSPNRNIELITNLVALLNHAICTPALVISCAGLLSIPTVAKWTTTLVTSTTSAFVNTTYLTSVNSFVNYLTPILNPSNLSTSNITNANVTTNSTAIISGISKLLKNKKKIKNSKSFYTNLSTAVITNNTTNTIANSLSTLLDNKKNGSNGSNSTNSSDGEVVTGFTNLLQSNQDPDLLCNITELLNNNKYKKPKKNKKASKRSKSKQSKSHISKKSKKYGISRHGGSHNCCDHDECLVDYGCNHNGSHKCNTGYDGSHAKSGSKHKGSKDCKDSNYKGSYHCKKGGSHKCNKKDNVVYRRKGTKKCGCCNCCFTSNDNKPGGGTIGNGNNNGLCEIQPYWSNFNDINCKMMLYDSNNNLIPNLNYPGFDTSISLKYETLATWQYDQIYRFLRDLELEMNRFKTKFKPYAKFELSYDYALNKVKIVNKTGAKFGIGFDFRRDGNFVTTGSLHKVLGFEQKIYLGLTEYISDYKCLIFEHSFPDDQLLLCADLIQVDQDNDIHVIPLGNPNPLTHNNMLYAIPLSMVHNFRPINGLDSFIELSESKFMVGCDCELFDPCKPISLNFYIRLMSGRHIKQNTQWNATLKVEYLSQRLS